LVKVAPPLLTVNVTSVIFALPLFPPLLDLPPLLPSAALASPSTVVLCFLAPFDDLPVELSLATLASPPDIEIPFFAPLADLLEELSSATFASPMKALLDDLAAFC
jgi:hypothetical protein